MRGVVVLRFGPFVLDTSTRQLSCGQVRIRLSPPQSAILAHLASYPGIVHSKEKLTEIGWGLAAVTDNSVEKVISRLRKILADGMVRLKPDSTDTPLCIETLAHQGYRFTGTVHKEERPVAGSLAEQLAPFREFVQGRTDLYSLGRDKVRSARDAFVAMLHKWPAYADAHVGLAMACGLLFEASAADAQPDTANLALGVEHGHTGCELANDSAEAWSTLAFVRYLNGETQDARAAACRASLLDPANWHHALREGFVSWGEPRLVASRRVHTLRPELALTYFLDATVFIGRGAFGPARDALRAGCAAQDAQPDDGDFQGVGLHLLTGQMLAACNRLPEAEAELQRELACAHSGHIYARECAANTCYVLGALALRQQRRPEANAFFTRALTFNPRHVQAATILRGEPPASACGVDRALGQAIVLARGNRDVEAARIYHDTLAKAPSGPAGWQLAIEPLLNPLSRRDVWARALALVRTRAS